MSRREIEIGGSPAIRCDTFVSCRKTGNSRLLCEKLLVPVISNTIHNICIQKPTEIEMKSLFDGSLSIFINFLALYFENRGGGSKSSWTSWSIMDVVVIRYPLGTDKKFWSPPGSCLYLELASSCCMFSGNMTPFLLTALKKVQFV